MTLVRKKGAHYRHRPSSDESFQNKVQRKGVGDDALTLKYIKMTIPVDYLLTQLIKASLNYTK